MRKSVGSLPPRCSSWQASRAPTAAGSSPRRTTSTSSSWRPGTRSCRHLHGRRERIRRSLHADGEFSVSQAWGAAGGRRPRGARRWSTPRAATARADAATPRRRWATASATSREPRHHACARRRRRQVVSARHRRRRRSDDDRAAGRLRGRVREDRGRLALPVAGPRVPQPPRVGAVRSAGPRRAAGRCAAAPGTMNAPGRARTAAARTVRLAWRRTWCIK